MFQFSHGKVPISGIIIIASRDFKIIIDSGDFGQGHFVVCSFDSQSHLAALSLIPDKISL